MLLTCYLAYTVARIYLNAHYLPLPLPYETWVLLTPYWPLPNKHTQLRTGFDRCHSIGARAQSQSRSRQGPWRYAEQREWPVAEHGHYRRQPEQVQGTGQTFTAFVLLLAMVAWRHSGYIQ